VLPFAGIVVVWSGFEPCLETLRIPAGGIVFGREHADPSDDRISRHHAEITVEDARISVADRNSRNGTYVNREGVGNGNVRPALPAIMRTGHTLSVLVPDVRPYEHVPISRRGSVVVAGTLDKPCRALDLAAVEEENVLIVGTTSIGRELALHYARTLGGKHILIDRTANASPIGRVLDAAGAPRTIILIVGQPLVDEDWETLATWLETDVRFVTVLRHDAEAIGMPADIVRRLGARMITIPRLRFDELPTTIRQMFQARAPHARIHVSAIEHALLQSRDVDEDQLLETFRTAIDTWNRSGQTTFRDEHVDEIPAWNPRHAIHGFLPPHRRP
jgi:hypothetical protein